MNDAKPRSTRTQIDGFWASPEQVVFGRLCFTYLLMSPSYELARKQRAGLLDRADEAALPPDVDVVLRVYDMLGDLKETGFEEWWPAKGIKAFGTQGLRPIVRPIDAIWPTKGNLAGILNERMNGFLAGPFQLQDPQACLIMSIPLTLGKSEIAEQIKDLIDAVPQERRDTPRREPVFPLYGAKRDLSGLIRYIKCAMCRSGEPDLTLWQIGVLAELSTTYSTRLALGKGTSEDQQALKMLASRALHRAVMISENAARGLFPTYEKCEHAVKLDWAKIGDVFSDHEGWSNGLEHADDL